jgi:hypothetical protein
MRNRITIQTTKELDDALEDARRATGRPTRSEVIRDALELYDLVVQHLMAGKHLYLGTARESAGEVLLPHLERAARRAGASPASPASPAAPATVRRGTAPPALSVVPRAAEPAASEAVARPAAPARPASKRRSDPA